MSKLYAFNRRSVEDQTIYVLADSEQEAWAKARANNAYDTNDSDIKHLTYRRLAAEDYARDQ